MIQNSSWRRELIRAQVAEIQEEKRQYQIRHNIRIYFDYQFWRKIKERSIRYQYLFNKSQININHINIIDIIGI